VTLNPIFKGIHLELKKIGCTRYMSRFFLFARGNFLHFFNLTNMISTYAKDFCKKMSLVINSPGFYYRFQAAKIEQGF